MIVSVVQPPYYAGATPDENIAAFLSEQLNSIENDSIIVLPEYSNAGGLSDPDAELRALPRAKEMLRTAAIMAKNREAYVVINVLEERDGRIKNSTYLFDKNGNTAFIYDKIHLPPSEIALGVERGSGSCFCDLDGFRFGFMTCYDVYFNEQIEHLAMYKPDLIIVPGYQRGERTDIIRAQAKLLAFRCNAYVVRSSYSMNDDYHGGCSMIVSPDGTILKDLGREVGAVSAEINPKWKYTRTAGFGGEVVRNDDFINAGLCPELFGY